MKAVDSGKLTKGLDLICSPETGQPEMSIIWESKRGDFHKINTVHRRADSPRTPPGGDGHADEGSDAQDGNIGADILPVE